MPLNILVLTARRLKTKVNESTISLTEAFMRGMYAASIKSKIDLKIDKEGLDPCKGCNSCWQSSFQKCNNIKGDGSIYQKFQGADLIIWSLPLYYYGSPSIMKAFAGLQAKSALKHVVISAGGFSTSRNAYEAINKQFKDMYKEKVQKILCPQSELFNLPQMTAYTAKYLTLVKKAGAEYTAKGQLSADTQRQLASPLFVKNDPIT